jgi:hypothetical protein
VCETGFYLSIAVLINTHVSSMLVLEKVASSKEEDTTCLVREQTKKKAINRHINSNIYPVRG